MERRIDYQKKLCNVCNDAMKSIVAMMKKRGIKVLDLKEKANECGIAYAHFYVDDEFVEDPITAVCLTSFESNMLFYTTELCIENELNVYDEDVMNQMKKSLKEKSKVVFSNREQEIVRYICQGMTNAEIAEELHLRPGTIKNIVSLLLSKCGCISRAQLVKYASEKGLVE